MGPNNDKLPFSHIKVGMVGGEQFENFGQFLESLHEGKVTTDDVKNTPEGFGGFVYIPGFNEEMKKMLDV